MVVQQWLLCLGPRRPATACPVAAGKVWKMLRQRPLCCESKDNGWCKPLKAGRISNGDCLRCHCVLCATHVLLACRPPASLHCRRGQIGYERGRVLCRNSAQSNFAKARRRTCITSCAAPHPLPAAFCWCVRALGSLATGRTGFSAD